MTDTLTHEAVKALRDNGHTSEAKYRDWRCPDKWITCQSDWDRYDGSWWLARYGEDDAEEIVQFVRYDFYGWSRIYQDCSFDTKPRVVAPLSPLPAPSLVATCDELYEENARIADLEIVIEFYLKAEGARERNDDDAPEMLDEAITAARIALEKGQIDE